MRGEERPGVDGQGPPLSHGGQAGLHPRRRSGPFPTSYPTTLMDVRDRVDSIRNGKSNLMETRRATFSGSQPGIHQAKVSGCGPEGECGCFMQG